jgi:single-stranded-DNA-specific exonuclease
LGHALTPPGAWTRPSAVVELFDTRDSDEARRLANHLDARNEERKDSATADHRSCCRGVERSKDSFVAVIAGEGWHRGVIGIAASKIAERLNRPCVVLSIDGEMAHGSGRSIEAYHLLNGLTACSDLV